MLQNYSGILIMFIFGAGLAIVFVVLSEMLGPRKPNAAKNEPFETGNLPFESPSGRHAVKFYLVGMLFVIFDIELIFLFPWAVVFRETGVPAFAAMLFFLTMFELGFLYVWRKGALQWK